MKLRFFTLNERKPVPGAIVNLRIQFDAKEAGDSHVEVEARGDEPSNTPAIAELLGVDGSVMLATTRTDRMGYGRIDLANLSEGFRKVVLVLLAYGVSSRQAKLILEVEGNSNHGVDVFNARGLYALLHKRPEFLAALSGANAEALAAAIFEMLGGTDDAFYLAAHASSARGQVGHVEDPDPKDYELSPESFVSRSAVKTGEGDGCEHLTPATLPLRQFSLYHVVVYDLAATKDPGSRRSLPSINGAPAVDSRVLWGQILEFEQQWKSLGHSLGEIKYSLALAPGEAVKVAVVDWKRTDAGSRLGANTSSDALLHNQVVDRDIDDIVKGNVAEKQSGSTFMAGLAGGMDFQIPQFGISAAGRHSIGYGTSNTEGKRDVSADAHQDVHLETLQRSNLVRSQNSTVVVQATQAESSYLSTRIVANMNRGHSLSILYYEVLRHLAVTTRFLRADTAILVPVEMFGFNAELARRFRAQIEPVLLDDTYRPCFAALERIAAGIADGSVVAPSTTPPPAPPPASTSSAVLASRFIIEFKTGWRWNKVTKNYNAPADTAGDIQVFARMNDGTTRQLLDSGFVSFEKFRTMADLGNVVPNWSIRYENNNGWCFAKYTADVRDPLNVRDIQGFVIKWRPVQLAIDPFLIARNADGWNLNEASITVSLSAGPLVIGRYAYPKTDDELFGNRDNNDHVEQGINIINLDKLAAPLATTTPLAAPPPPAATGTATANAAASDLSSQQQAQLLVNHLNANQYYYNSSVWLLMDPRERRQRIAGYVGGLLAGMSDTPLAMSGNHLAFRYAGKTLPAAAREVLPDVPARLAPKESIVTLPTRGIFAEAHMGNCNAAEKRDITRLWNFDELPVSLLPNIETLTAGPKGTYQGLSPDAVNATPLSVQGTPELPAPEAIAKALELLAKPDIFRDQSTREQVAEIMGKLIESAQPPKLTGDNIGSAFGGGKSGNGAVSDPNEWANPFPDRSKSSASTSDRPSPTERYDHSTVDNEVVLKAKDNGVSDADAAELAKDAATKSIDPTPKRVATAKRKYSITLRSDTVFEGDVSRSLNGTITLTIKNAELNKGEVERAKVDIDVRRGQGMGVVELVPGRYIIDPFFVLSDPEINFIQDTMGDIEGLTTAIKSSMVTEMGGLRDFTHMSPDAMSYVFKQNPDVLLRLKLDIGFATKAEREIKIEEGSGYTLGAGGKLEIDTGDDGFAKAIGSKLGKSLKSLKGGPWGIIASMIEISANVNAEGKLTGSNSDALTFSIRPMVVKHFDLQPQ